MIQLIDAIKRLVPGAEVVVRGNEIEWIKPLTAPVTEKQIFDEFAKMQNEYEKVEYQRKRASKYPDFKDYLDGIVKGDQQQIQNYIDACKQVKLKYPKP